MLRVAGSPTVAKKNPTSFRLSDEAIRIISELQERFGVSQADVVEMALRELYRKETGQNKPLGNPKDST